MSALDLMREFVESYPDADMLSALNIDYTDKIPNCAGLFPDGLVEVSRHYDIFGNAYVTNQYNFALYTLMEKAPGEDAGAEANAEWQMGFQEWVQRQSIYGNVPVFGDEPRSERIVAQNGAIYSADDEGTAVYAIQIAVTFVRHYEKE